MRGLGLNKGPEIGSDQGDASWADHHARNETSWQWRLQAIDRKSVHAANSLFAC
jgi:hypothetical protein